MTDQREMFETTVIVDDPELSKLKGGVAELKRRRKKPKRPPLPPVQWANCCILLAIDPGARAGAAILDGEEHLVDASLCRKAAERRAVVAKAVALATNTRTPLVVVIEDWTAGGEAANPAMLIGLGAQRGRWQEQLELAGVERDQVVPVHPQRWHAATVGGRRSRWKGREIELAQMLYPELRRRKQALDGDTATAILIARWGSHAGEVAEAIERIGRRRR